MKVFSFDAIGLKVGHVLNVGNDCFSTKNRTYL